MTVDTVYILTMALPIAFLGGYIFKHVQDSKYMSDIKDIYEDHAKDIKATFNEREKLYKDEINRLHSITADYAAEKIVKNPDKATMTDFVELALSADGYQEVDFPNSRR